MTVAAPVTAADWPTYRHDSSRSGIAAESLTFPLGTTWVHRSRHAPEPAWGDPKPVPIEDILELRRVHFDDAYQVVGAGHGIYFGSSADNKLYALDKSTGRVRWTFSAAGPIRLAPSLANDRVYFSSDDGHVYCLNAADGQPVWNFRAAPEDQRLLGHGKMISRWPSRTGVLVDGGVAYFAAGIFPAEGVFIYAVDAASGRVIWKNDTTGEKPQSRVSPQGYLLASPSILYAPMGRVSPAALDRKTGRLLYETSFGKPVGGSYALLAGGDVFTGTEQIAGFHQATRDRFATFPGRRMVVTDETYFVATDKEVMAMDRRNKTTRWKTSCHASDELILAGDTLVAGGPGQVLAIDTAKGAVRWRGEVEGIAKGLSVVDGQLLVSTDRGIIYCFGGPGSQSQGTVQQPAVAGSFAATPANGLLERAAAGILKQTGIERGYCLVLGCESGQLGVEIARRSKLRVYMIDSDPGKVTAVRKAIDAAGLLGARVCVECWPWQSIPYSDYFANLVVSETALVTGQWPLPPSAAARFVKPLGGVLILGASEPEGKKLAASVLQDARQLAGFKWAGQGGSGGQWIRCVRGALPGAGNWTQQYANPGNTACGDDTRVKGPLELLWFGRPGEGQMMNRHQRAAGPVSFGGRLFIQGENVVMAYDIYNGLKLWQRDIPGAVRPNASHDGGNLAVSGQGLFVAVKDHCLRLDLDTGQTLATYRVPPPAAGGFGRWGYIALDGRLLLGTRAAGAGQSNALFAFDVETGEQRWIYEGKRLLHNAIAMGDGRLFLVQSTMTRAQREQALKASGATNPTSAPAKTGQAKDSAPAQPLIRLVVSLDARTGRPVWEKPMDLTHCGNAVSAMYHDGALVIFGVYLDGHYWKEFFAGQFASRRVTVLNGSDGQQLWSRAVGYRVRPLIIGDTLHAEPWAFQLKTGQPVERENPITGQTEAWQFARPGHHCGCPSGSENCLFFRSWNLGYYDLAGDYGTTHFGGQRPGCWINFIPAGGLVLMPEASTGCMCDFPTHSTVVFKPTAKQRSWAWYSISGSVTPVKHLAMNLGAPGDRRDASGQLWLAYPRPRGSLVVPHEIDAAFYRGGRFREQNSAYFDVQGTTRPWLFASAAHAVRKLSVPLLEPGDGKAAYHVRLYFAETESPAPGKRRFDIQLQGNVVAPDFDIQSAAGGARRALVKDFSGVEVDGKLHIELVAHNPRGTPETLPILQGVEIEREAFTAPGCRVPSLTLNNHRPEEQAVIQLANLSDHALDATLKLSPPPGITVKPLTQEVHLPPGTRRPVSVTARLDAGLAPGKYQIGVQLVQGDGNVVRSESLPVEHLGPRGRVVLKAVEDAHVTQRYPDRNQSTGGVMLVDGGGAKMRDRDHSVALIRFRLDVPGKPVSARFRIVDAGNPTGDAGSVRLIESAWDAKKVTYQTRPELGPVLAKLGRVSEHQVVEVPLSVQLAGKKELSIAIDPTSTDGVDFISREGGTAPELIVEYEQR